MFVTALCLQMMFMTIHSTFTRVQRVTCALCLLLTTMLANLMFYGIPSNDPSEQVCASLLTVSLYLYYTRILMKYNNNNNNYCNSSYDVNGDYYDDDTVDNAKYLGIYFNT